MLSVLMNDAAAEALGVGAGSGAGFRGVDPPGGLEAGLRELAARGIVRRGRVLLWADSQVDAAGAPAGMPDLTGWECSVNALHLEDFVAVNKTLLDDGRPLMGGSDQGLLLRQGLALALEFRRLVEALQPPAAVRCIIGANDTNATFRFHQLRPGESWITSGLDSYRQEKLVAVDIEPPGTNVASRLTSPGGPARP